MEIYNADGSQVGDVRQRHPLLRQVCLRPWHYQKRSGEWRPSPASFGRRSSAIWSKSTWANRSSRAKIPVDADGEINNGRYSGRQKLRNHLRVDGQPPLRRLRRRYRFLGPAKARPDFEHHPFFPKRVNTEFVKIISRSEVQRVWERGAGETLACGTGASAVGCRRDHRPHGAGSCGSLKGGDLVIEWRDNNRVYMTGGAAEVFHGTVLREGVQLCLAVQWSRW